MLRHPWGQIWVLLVLGVSALEIQPQFARAALSRECGSVFAQDSDSEMREILQSGLSAPLNGTRFNSLVDQLLAFGQSRGIKITRTLETLGVYPKSLREIQVAGFSLEQAPDAEIAWPVRHELGHLIHTLQLRAHLLERASTPQELAEMEHLVQRLESGWNYLEFEKIVTTSASLVHQFKRNSNPTEIYLERMLLMSRYVEAGALAGKMRFPGERNLEGAYATFLSKAPLVLGTSLKSAAARIPLFFFAIAYATNMDLSFYGLSAELVLGAHHSDQGFRDLVNFVLTK